MQSMDNLSANPRTHMAEGENQLLKAVKHSVCKHTHEHTLNRVNSKLKDPGVKRCAVPKRTGTGSN